MKLALKLILIIFSLLLLIIVWQGLDFLYFPAEKNAPLQIFKIEKGSGFALVSRELTNRGLIKNRRLFLALVRLHKAGKRLQRGEYELSRSMLPTEILAIITSGRVKRYKVTIPEGYNLYQIAEQLSKAGLVNKKKFLALAFDRSWLEQLKLTSRSVEGFLYPDTYFFSKSQGAAEIQREMVNLFWQNFSEEDKRRAAELKLNTLEVVTLASIIEKETAVASERPLISAVFHNRLRKKMRLQADPTVIYGLLPNFDGNLTRKHLNTYGPYNTYRIKGLPQGPIANPGKAALKAALYPAKSKALYFVSRNDGTHIFSDNLRAHNNNVIKYQKRRRYRR